ncbi:MAG: anhydro-N-acetylmuramic acid kinase [Alphaproteobacteria bacterium]|nr:anhydro-N-acetylmuramic acid kinase [Alphaproteobacteria bacterium]
MAASSNIGARSGPQHSPRIWRAIGLMSGTSLDGIDVAVIETDGRDRVSPGPALTLPYPQEFQERLRSVLGGRGPVSEAEEELTRLHAEAVEHFLRENSEIEVDLVGFHGHTILHRPAERRTWQMGNGALLAQRLGLDVVADFRSTDVAAGGEGAPLAPLYHAALAATLPKPLAVLNLGGVANVTWIGGAEELLAFDTGPGNALIDDWVRRHSGAAADLDGSLARAGAVSAVHVEDFLANPFFNRLPPKSLDRDDFREAWPTGLSLEDGAATLTEMTAAAVAAATRHFPAPAEHWLVTGGGRHNPALMEALDRNLEVAVRPVEAVGWHGDALEAQAFAYLAVRSILGLPLSLPSTTGVARPTWGGRLFKAPRPHRGRGALVL